MGKSKVPIQIGARWGRVECTGVKEREFVEYDEFNMENTGKYDFLQFLCDCGKRFEVRWDLWKGKRAAKDCGCGIALVLEPKFTITVQLPLPMARQARIKAEQAGNGLSQWVRDQIQKGISS